VHLEQAEHRPRQLRKDIDFKIPPLQQTEQVKNYQIKLSGFRQVKHVLPNITSVPEGLSVNEIKNLQALKSGLF
jgi:hypothetical protein